MTHKLSPLRFPYDALEPYIDAETMELHHDKHHQAYVDNLNKAIAPYPQLAELTARATRRRVGSRQRARSTRMAASHSRSSGLIFGARPLSSQSNEVSAASAIRLRGPLFGTRAPRS